MSFALGVCHFASGKAWEISERNKPPNEMDSAVHENVLYVLLSCSTLLCMKHKILDNQLAQENLVRNGGFCTVGLFIVLVHKYSVHATLDDVVLLYFDICCCLDPPENDCIEIAI